MFRATRQILAYDDCLWLFRIFCIDIFENKFMKILLKITFYIVLFLTLFQTVEFLITSESRYFMKYQAVYCSSFFILLSIYTIPDISHSIIKFMGELDFWPIDFAGPTVERRIKLEALYCHIFIIVTTTIAVLSGIFHALPLEEDEDIFYTIATIRKYCPQFQNVLIFFYRCGMILMSVVMPANFYMVIYFTTQIKFQGYMLIYRLQGTNNDLENNKDDLIDDYEFQKTLQENMIFFAKRHALLIRNGNLLLKKKKSFIFAFSVCGTILFVSILSFIFSGSFEGRYSRLVTLIIPAGLIFVHVIICGQKLEEMGSSGHDILLLSSWHNMNQINKKIYLMALPHTLLGFKLKFSESIAINYELAVSILKSVYSILSLMGYFANVKL